MKRTALYIAGFALVSLSLTSCVSKKKFDDLARAKTMSDRQVAQLKKDKSNLEKNLQQAKDDFNKIRYELTENNAAKDKKIDELYTKLRGLESKQTALKTELEDINDQMKYSSQSSTEA